VPIKHQVDPSVAGEAGEQENRLRGCPQPGRQPDRGAAGSQHRLIEHWEGIASRWAGAARRPRRRTEAMGDAAGRRPATSPSRRSPAAGPQRSGRPEWKKYLKTPAWHGDCRPLQGFPRYHLPRLLPSPGFHRKRVSDPAYAPMTIALRRAPAPGMVLTSSMTGFKRDPFRFCGLGPPAAVPHGLPGPGRLADRAPPSRTRGTPTGLASSYLERT